MCSRKIDADLILVNEHETISNHYLGRWMSGLVSGLQNQPRLFESGTALNNFSLERSQRSLRRLTQKVIMV